MTEPGPLKRSPVLRVARSMRSSAPGVFYALVALAVMEATAAWIAPAFLPDTLYIKAFLGKAAVEQTQTFVRNEDPYLVWDQTLGWRSRPNSGRNKWRVDEFGARTTHPITKERTGKTRVLFLGSSLIQSPQLSEEETISAYVEDETTEALNFGTMLYSLDQMALAFREQLSGFDPDLVVVGVRGDPFPGLRNRYVPLLWREEKLMPYMKPRFVLEGADLKLIPPPTLEAFATLFSEPDLLRELEETDEYFREFDRFKRYGFLPVLGTVSAVSQKAMNLARRFQNLEASGSELLVQLLKRLQRDVEAQGAEVVFLVFTTQDEAYPSGIKGLLPDQHGDLVEIFETNGLPFIDVRETFLREEHNPWELFLGDGVHFIAPGNEIMAGAVKDYLDNTVR